MEHLMNDDEIRQIVRERYAQVARALGANAFSMECG